MKFKSGQIRNLELQQSRETSTSSERVGHLSLSPFHPDPGHWMVSPSPTLLSGPHSLLPLPWPASSLCPVLWNEISLESGHSGASGANLTCMCLSSCACYHPATTLPRRVPSRPPGSRFLCTWYFIYPQEMA